MSIYHSTAFPAPHCAQYISFSRYCLEADQSIVLYPSLSLQTRPFKVKRYLHKVKFRLLYMLHVFSREINDCIHYHQIWREEEQKRRVP